MDEIKTGELTSSIKAEARKVGFNLVGVTTPDPPPHLEVYEHWLAQGRHGEMAYLANDRARSRREDPRRIMPECKSILVVALDYSPADVHRGVYQGRARVASYALGDDYHEVLVDRLSQVMDTFRNLQREPIAYRIYTDTGPILERELAQRAGLGWIGKNTCLINPNRGSHLLLAEVLLAVELNPDPPFLEDRCGTCTRCIDACPTGCILSDRTLDARRCISYLTIEHRGRIPLDLREWMGDWVFGCDICQEVCPWNARFARATGDASFQPRAFLLPPTVGKFLELSEDAYREELRGSPLKRPKLAGLMRNGCIAAGNSEDPSFIPRLKEILLSDSSASVRGHAAWALGRIGGQEAPRILEDAWRVVKDAGVREEIKLGLSTERLVG